MPDRLGPSLRRRDQRRTAGGHERCLEQAHVDRFPVMSAPDHHQIGGAPVRGQPRRFVAGLHAPFRRRQHGLRVGRDQQPFAFAKIPKRQLGLLLPACHLLRQGLQELSEADTATGVGGCHGGQRLLHVEAHVQEFQMGGQVPGDRQCRGEDGLVAIRAGGWNENISGHVWLLAKHALMPRNAVVFVDLDQTAQIDAGRHVD